MKNIENNSELKGIMKILKKSLNNKIQSPLVDEFRFKTVIENAIDQKLKEHSFN